MRVLILVVALLSAAPAAFAEEQNDRTVIVIGIDGMRWDAIDRIPAETLRGLARDGVRAQGLISVFPSVTFPNFYSLATGLHPSRSGVLGNSTYDRDLDATFTMQTATDGRWFQGEPIWVTAERQGVRTATLFWVGSEAEIAGQRPSYAFRYDGDKPHAERIEQVLAWIDLPASERPRLIMLYFSAVDSALHRNGVGSIGEREALLDVDRHIDLLLDGLDARGLRASTDLIVVSDHGMEDIAEERSVYLDDYLPETLLTLRGGLQPGRGSATSIGWFVDTPEQADAIYAALAFAHPQMQVWKRADIPERFRFEHPTRTPDVLALAEPGWLLSRRDAPLSETYRATHGWDPDRRVMHAAFIADGPSFPDGVLVAPIANVNIYSLVAHLLEITPADTDGSLETVQGLLRQDGRE